MRRFPWWFWASFLPIGLGAWAPIVPGVQQRRPAWTAWGALWSALLVAGIALAGDEHRDLSGTLIIVAWVGAIVTSAIIRSDLAKSDAGWSAAKVAARGRIARREEALRLAVEDPSLARELGIGRPDLNPETAGGVVDVNHASAAAIATLPGVDAELAEHIAGARDDVNGFKTLVEMGGVLGLDAPVVERMRGYAVFLPR